VVVINTLNGGDRLFSRRMACPSCGISIPEMSPRAFSFNSPHGACPACQGLGAVYRLRSRANRRRRHALAVGGPSRPGRRVIGGSSTRCSRVSSRRSASSSDTPFGKLPKKLRDIVLYGAPGRRPVSGSGRRAHAARAVSAPTSRA
jgi:excinuclease ABC subunit A